MLPLHLCGQDTLQAGTFVVRKVHMGDFIPGGLEFLGNLGGSSSGGGSAPADTITIKGRVLRVYQNDSTPIRSATVLAAGRAAPVYTDANGNFQVKVSLQSTSQKDSFQILVQHQTDWDTTITVPLANNTDDFIVTHYIPDVATKTGMSRQERRREMLKRIFFPWKWFQKEDKLPPREPREVAK